MKTRSNRETRYLLEARQAPGIVRGTCAGLALFFAAFPWFMLALMAFSGGYHGARPGVAQSVALLSFLVVLVAAWRLCDAFARHWNEYPYYPSETGLLRKSHAAVAAAIVACLIFASWPACLGAITLLAAATALFEFVATGFGERTVRRTRCQFGMLFEPRETDSALSGPDHADTPVLHESVAIPGIFRPAAERIAESFEPDTDPELLQCQTRKVGLRGEEAVEGMVRVHFPRNEEQAVVHLGFCPPLNVVPTLEVETVADTEIETTIAQIQMFGARLELKRRASNADEPLSEETITVNYYASAPAAQVAARFAK